MTASTASPLFVTPGQSRPIAMPRPQRTAPIQWQSLGLADRLRLYVLVWMCDENRFNALANDATSDAIPTFVCLKLSDGSLHELPGDKYASHIECWLLIGEHIVDSRSVYQRAVASVKATMKKEVAASFDPQQASLHKRIHAEEHRLIEKDAQYYWLHNINYPGLVMLMQNHFYQVSPERLSTWVTDALLAFELNRSSNLTWGCEQIDPWLFEQPNPTGPSW